MHQFEVGMPVLIIGCRTDEGLKDIGKSVVIEMLLNTGDEIPKQFTTIGAPLRSGSTVPTAIVAGDLKQHLRIAPGYAHFELRHLMPIPPLDDDILEETNIKQREGEAA